MRFVMRGLVQIFQVRFQLKPVRLADGKVLFALNP